LTQFQSHPLGSSEVLLPLLAGIFFLGVFLRIESKRAEPMLDLKLFRNATFSASAATIFLNATTMVSSQFLFAQFLQHVLLFTPLQNGLIQVPAFIVAAFFSSIAGRMTDRVGARRLCVLGLALTAGALLLLTTLDSGSPAWLVIFFWMIWAVGIEFTTIPATGTAIKSAPTRTAGVGSGVILTMRQIGGAFGVAVMGLMIATQVSVGQSSPVYASQYQSGFQIAMFVSAGILIATALFVIPLMKRHGELVEQPLEVAVEVEDG
jgi:predicted MFS family arabinose efflux permease